MQKKAYLAGANNFDVYTVLKDDEFSSDFGITPEEIEKVIKDFGIEEQKENIKEWYDGYTIGKTKRNLQSMEYYKLHKKERFGTILGKHKFK